MSGKTDKGGEGVRSLVGTTFCGNLYDAQRLKGEKLMPTGSIIKELGNITARKVKVETFNEKLVLKHHQQSKLYIRLYIPAFVYFCDCSVNSDKVIYNATRSQ